MKDKVSVIVITKNSARTISECLDSLNKQSYPSDHYELIVVDGASSDETVNICRKYPVKLIELKMSGIPLQRNIGINNAEGEFVAFLDSDDIASKDWIRDSISHLNSHKKENVAAVGCSHTLINEKDNFIRLAWLEHSFRHSRSPEDVNHLGTSGSIFIKAVVNEVGGFDIALAAAEDMDLSSRIINAGYSIHLLKEPLIKVEYANGLWRYLRKQTRNVAYMLVFYLKPKSVRRNRGSYSNRSEYLQGVLPALFLLSSLILRNFGVLLALAIWLLALIILNLSFVGFISNQKKASRLGRMWRFIVLPYLFLRSIAWCVGLTYGGLLAASNLFQGRHRKCAASGGYETS
jgi:glycosyltransferase involved in cell wall biosynthesis